MDECAGEDELAGHGVVDFAFAFAELAGETPDGAVEYQLFDLGDARFNRDQPLLGG
jgi:hypothetical protein